MPTMVMTGSSALGRPWRVNTLRSGTPLARAVVM
jgi:hypothetical protein